jgi:hypothetical protein
MGNDDGIFAVRDGAEDVRAQDDPIFHPDGHIPINPYAITDLASGKSIEITFLLIHGITSLCSVRSSTPPIVQHLAGFSFIRPYAAHSRTFHHMGHPKIRRNR